MADGETVKDELKKTFRFTLRTMVVYQKFIRKYPEIKESKFIDAAIWEKMLRYEEQQKK